MAELNEHKFTVSFNQNERNIDLSFQKMEQSATLSGVDTIVLPNGVTDKHFVYSQLVASNSWDIIHNMDKYPSVTIVDSANSIVVGEVTYISKNELIVSFAGAFSGKAYLN
jgi:hypothetical protein